MLTVLRLLKFGAVVTMGLVLMTTGLGYLTFALTGAGKWDLASLPADERLAPATPEQTHGIEEWPADRPRSFMQSPTWDEAVASGSIPPVAARLPDNPPVIVPPEQTGPYGGTWVTYGTSPQDVDIQMLHRICRESLVRWSPSGHDIWPNLAHSWTIDDDGRTFTFHLRRGVRWSDGAPLTTRDVRFAWDHVLGNRELTPIVDARWTSEGQRAQLEVIGDYSFRLRFAEPNGLLLYYLPQTGLDLVRYPEHYLKQFHADLAEPTALAQRARRAGFELWPQLFLDRCEWRNTELPRIWAWLPATFSGQPVLFHRNPYYWKVDPDGRQLPYLDQVEFHIMDFAAISMRLINGQLGYQFRHLGGGGLPLYVSHREQGHYEVRRGSGSDNHGTHLLALNLNHPDPVLRSIIQDDRFRKALSHAIDRDEINRACFLGQARPQQLCPPKGSPYHYAPLANAYLTYDPDLANRMLDEVGLTRRDARGRRLRSDGQPVFIQIEMTDVFFNPQVMELIAEYWRAVGIDAQVKVQARSLYEQRRRSGLIDCGTWGGAGNPLLDPIWYVPIHEESIYAVQWGRWFATHGQRGEEPPPPIQEAQQLLVQIRRTTDPAQQAALFRRILELNHEHLWIIGTLADTGGFSLVHERFRNVARGAAGAPDSPANIAPECFAWQADN